MPRFRKKPVIIEAEQFLRGNEPALERFLGRPSHSLRGVEDIRVRTIHGEEAIAREGDWIIAEGRPGRFYPCKPDIFEATYEAVEEGS